MLRNLTNIFKNLTLSSSVSKPIGVQRYCNTLPPKDIVGEKEIDIAGDNESTDKVVKKSLLLYNQQTLEKSKFDKYPFYIEREWWKDGKRMTFWANWRQLRDVRRRRALAECGADRMRLKALKENTILPQALRDEMSDKLHNMNRYSRPSLILNLCMFTGRRRGKIKPFRVNRHIFRRLADHSQLSGVQRAMW
uniref:28S ribosomal protein S14, mitochondrial n=1 Tax=Parastrongyloides trichosuri TaxID=131310 RepID=A0A0N4Z640_PARTI